MTMTYCPDCGSECQKEERKCTECHFPLKLTLLEYDQTYRTQSSQRESWRRVFTLLRKSGLHIETTYDRSMTGSQAWFVFPGIGLIVLILSVLFSQTLADWLIPAKPVPISIEFTQNTLGSQRSSEHGESTESTSLLMDALKTTDDQETVLTEPGDYEVKEIVSRDEILRFARQATVSIRIDSEEGYGTVFLPGGYILTSYDLTRRAFERVKGNFTQEGSFVQGIQIIEPIIEHEGESLKPVSLIHRVENPPISILKTDYQLAIPFTVNFHQLPDVGETLWISYHEGNRVQVSKVKVVESIEMNNVAVQVVDFEGGLLQDGNPVFNVFGEMVGILVSTGEMMGILANVHIREKAPYIYRDIHNILSGKATKL